MSPTCVLIADQYAANEVLNRLLCFDLAKPERWMIIMTSLSMATRRPISDSSTAC
jgi:hypothetical protein